MAAQRLHTGRTASRGRPIGMALGVVADALDTLGDEQWGHQSLCDGWSTRDVVGHLVWRVGSPTHRFVGDILVTTAQKRHLNPMASMDDIARREGQARSIPMLVAELRRIAAQKSKGVGRTNPAELLEAIVHGYDALQPLNVPLGFAPESTHQVARMAQATAGRDARLLLRNRRLVAGDAGWSIGNGSPIVADAASIILYLTGRKAQGPNPAKLARTHIEAPGNAPFRGPELA
jgi:uncharacterized protein (TIGR03083 family)